MLRLYGTCSAVNARGTGRSQMFRLIRQWLSIIALIVAIGLQVSCARQPVLQENVSRLDHDLLSDIVIITDTRFDGNDTIVDIYITNPHHYELNIYEIEGQH